MRRSSVFHKVQCVVHGFGNKPPASTPLDALESAPKASECDLCGTRPRAPAPGRECEVWENQRWYWGRGLPYRRGDPLSFLHEVETPPLPLRAPPLRHEVRTEWEDHSLQLQANWLHFSKPLSFNMEFRTFNGTHSISRVAGKSAHFPSQRDY